MYQARKFQCRLYKCLLPVLMLAGLNTTALAADDVEDKKVGYAVGYKLGGAVAQDDRMTIRFDRFKSAYNDAVNDKPPLKTMNQLTMQKLLTASEKYRHHQEGAHKPDKPGHLGYALGYKLGIGLDTRSEHFHDSFISGFKDGLNQADVLVYDHKTMQQARDNYLASTQNGQPASSISQ